MPSGLREVFYAEYLLNKSAYYLKKTGDPEKDRALIENVGLSGTPEQQQKDRAKLQQLMDEKKPGGGITFRDLQNSGVSLSPEEIQKAGDTMLQMYNGKCVQEYNEYNNTSVTELPFIEEEMTANFRRVDPNYRVRDREAMMKRRELMPRAQEVMANAAMQAHLAPGSGMAQNITQMRESSLILTYAHVCMGDREEELRRIEELGRQEPVTAEYSRALKALGRDALSHALEHTPEMMNRVRSGMTDEQKIENWPQWASYAQFCAEHEKLCDYCNVPEDEIPKYTSQMREVQGMDMMYHNQMSVLASPLGGSIDMEEAEKLPTGVDLTGGNPDPTHRMAAMINASNGSAGTRITEAAQRKMGVPYTTAMLAMTTDGKLVDMDDLDVRTQVMRNRTPLYMRPVDQPDAVPVLTQPLNNEGYTVAGDDIANIETPDLKAITPPKKPSLGDRFKDFFKRVFSGGKNRVESCRDYERDYAAYQEKLRGAQNLTNSKEQLGELTSPEKLEQVKQKMQGLQEELRLAKEARLAENHGMTVEQYREKLAREAAEAEAAKKAAAEKEAREKAEREAQEAADKKAEEDFRTKLAQTGLSPEQKQGLQDLHDLLRENRQNMPAELKRGNTSDLRRETIAGSVVTYATDQLLNKTVDDLVEHPETAQLSPTVQSLIEPPENMPTCPKERMMERYMEQRRDLSSQPEFKELYLDLETEDQKEVCAGRLSVSAVRKLDDLAKKVVPAMQQSNEPAAPAPQKQLEKPVDTKKVGGNEPAAPGVH